MLRDPIFHFHSSMIVGKSPWCLVYFWKLDWNENKFSLQVVSLVIPLPFQSLTWNLKMAPWNRRFLLETIMIRFHSFNSGSVLEIHFRTLPPQPLLRPLSGFKSATDRFAVLVRLPSRQFDIEKKGLSWCQKPSIDLTEFSECFFFFFLVWVVEMLYHT